jgi:hypothetical protein
MSSSKGTLIHGQEGYPRIARFHASQLPNVWGFLNYVCLLRAHSMFYKLKQADANRSYPVVCDLLYLPLNQATGFQETWYEIEAIRSYHNLRFIKVAR